MPLKTLRYGDTETELSIIFTELEDLINDAARRITAEHYEVAQEPAFTSRLAQEIEIEIRRHPVNAGSLKVEVATQDLPDRGRGAMEKKVGADLYISLARRDLKPPVSKGMLMQAKWEYSKHDAKLASQMHSMMERTDDSYVWFYGADEVTCAKAYDIMHTDPLEFTSVGKLIVDGLRCSSGDRAIGRDLALPRGQAMRRQLKELAEPTGLALAIVKR